MTKTLKKKDKDSQEKGSKLKSRGSELKSRYGTLLFLNSYQHMKQTIQKSYQIQTYMYQIQSVNIHNQCQTYMYQISVQTYQYQSQTQNQISRLQKLILLKNTVIKSTSTQVDFTKFCV